MKTEILPDEAIELLRKRIVSHGALQEFLPLYESLIRMESEADVPALALDLEAVKSGAGLDDVKAVPFLHRPSVQIPYEQLIPGWQKVCELAAGYLWGSADKPDELKRAPVERYDAWRSMMKAYFEKNEITVHAPEEKDRTGFVLIHTWRPFLVRWQHGLRKSIANILWSKPLCPMCGGRPDFGYLGAQNGELHLLCARCDTDWNYPRAVCVHCANQDSKTYFYYPGDAGKYRLYACRKCMHYLKTLDCRLAGEEPVLAVERICTTGMDEAAIRESYVTF